MTADLLRFDSVVSCTIVERINRFVVAVDVDGKTASSLDKQHRPAGGVYAAGHDGLLPAEGGRKTNARLFAIADGDAAALVDTRFHMDAFEHGVRQQRLPWLHECPIVRRDAPLGDSRIDYLLSCAGEPCYFEVKSAVFRSGRTALYPDCPSTRGQRHVAGLIVAAADAGVAVHAIGLCYLPERRSVVLFDEDLTVLPPAGRDDDAGNEEREGNKGKEENSRK
ncbi:MAG: DNA/RNA nuclease SfsA [Thermoplasmatota archaeon]